MQVFAFIYLQILSLWLRKFHIQSPSSIRRSKYTTEIGKKVQTTVAFATRPAPVGCPKSTENLYLPNMYARFLKRPLDFCCALAAILALSPLLLVLTVLGAVKMHGNPFFTQPRPGLNEKIFKLVKFLRSTSLDFFLLGGPALR